MTNRDDDKHDHQRALGNRTLFLVAVLRKEEQSSETDLLDVQSDEHVLDSFGEEEASRVVCTGLLELPEEEVLVQHEEEEEGNEGETVDNR